MGDATSCPVRLSCNPQLRVEFRGATVTSDAGLLLSRQLDEHLGLSALIERHLSDPRTGHNRQFPLPDLFRQSIYSRLAGYEDTNERLARWRDVAARGCGGVASLASLCHDLHGGDVEVSKSYGSSRLFVISRSRGQLPGLPQGDRAPGRGFFRISLRFLRGFLSLVGPRFCNSSGVEEETADA